MTNRPSATDGPPVLYGFDASVYVRSVRLALAEKGLDHVYTRTASFDGYDKLPVNDGLHPFGNVPVLDHGGARLYESGAIHDYLELAFRARPLVPKAPMEAARMRQLIAVYDNYAHGPWTGVIVTERLFPGPGGRADEGAIADALAPARRALAAVGAILETRGDVPVDRADLHLAPAVHYLMATPEGAEMVAETASVSAWWNRIGTRASVRDLLTLPAA